MDPRTPVVVGVGQSTERIDDADYRGMSAVELAAAGARAALDDSGADVARWRRRSNCRRHKAVRDFRTGQGGLGQVQQLPAVGGQPDRRRSGPCHAGARWRQGPQNLMTELAGEIAAGRSKSRWSSAPMRPPPSYFADARQPPDFSENVGGQLEDRGMGLEQLISRYTIIHGLAGAPTQYGLLDNARRAGTGLRPADYLRRMAELFAPFTKVAAGTRSPPRRSNAAWRTDHRHRRNRMISDPYPRLLVARDTSIRAPPRW